MTEHILSNPGLRRCLWVTFWTDLVGPCHLPSDLGLTWSADEQDTEEVCYLQSQNGNLFSAQSFTGGGNPTEFFPLTEDVPSEVSWMSEALGIFCGKAVSKAINSI